MDYITSGNTAEIYAYKKDQILKLFFQGYPEMSVQHEYKNALAMQDAKLPIPYTYGLIQMNDRSGIIYERLYGCSLQEQLLGGENPEDLMEMMANLHKQIMSIQMETEMTYKEFLLLCIKDHHSDEANELIDQIHNLPEDHHLCHGDYHPGNVWVNKNGSLSVIDFMNVCTGPMEYDVARTYFLIAYGDISNDLPNHDVIQKLKKSLSTLYLNKMGFTVDSIKKYLDIIIKCRPYEMNLIT